MSLETFPCNGMGLQSFLFEKLLTPDFLLRLAMALPDPTMISQVRLIVSLLCENLGML